MAATLDPKSDGSAGVWQKALDSLNPARGRNALDAFKRRLARKRFLERLRPAKPELMVHMLPEIDPDRPKGTIALTVPAEQINRFIEKLVRGTVYVTERRYIESSQEITVSLIRIDDAAPITQMVEEFGELYERGPGIRIRKAIAEDGKTNAIFVFDIWGQYRFHGAVMERDLL